MRTKNGTATLQDKQFLTNLNILLPYDLAITLLCIYSKELNTYVQSKTYTCIFIAAVLILAKTWRQPRYRIFSRWTLGDWVNSGTLPSRHWAVTQGWKEMSFHATKRHRGNLNLYYLMKEANMKKLLTVWLQLYDILVKAKLWSQWNNYSGFQGGWREGWIGRAQRLFRAVNLFCVI